MKWYCAFLFVLYGTVSHAATTTIAVAANFSDTMRTLINDFQHKTNHQVIASFGSTGKLYTQIIHGAPFDIFLAADTARPLKLVEQGLGVADSQFSYATGQLVFWSPRNDAFQDAELYLKQQHFSRIAIANPATAPYGFAAQQVLQQLQLWPALQSKLVRGDSVAQTFQFIATQNASAGFIAASQLKHWQGNHGSVWQVPTAYYDPIQQGAVLLSQAADNPAAQALLHYLQSDAAHALIQQDGYGVQP